MTKPDTSFEDDDLEILDHAETKIGTIYYGRRRSLDGERWIYEIQIDAELLMSSISPVSERELATRALALHRGTQDLSVLVGGLGLGYTAEAALADPRVSRVDVAEKMDFVIDWMTRGLFPLSKLINEDPRCSILQTDIYEMLLSSAEPSQTYDLILVDVDHSPDDPLSWASRPFYTVEGQRTAARHLNPGGVMAVWSAHDNEEFSGVMGQAWSNSRRDIVEWPNEEMPELPFVNAIFLGW